MMNVHDVYHFTLRFPPDWDSEGNPTSIPIELIFDQIEGVVEGIQEDFYDRLRQIPGIHQGLELGLQIGDYYEEI